MSKFVSVAGAAEELGVSRTTMSAYLRNGRVSGARLINEGDGDPRGDRWLIRTPVRLRPVTSLTVPEAARLLGVSRARAWQLVRSGALKAEREPGSRWWRVQPAAVTAYLARQEGAMASAETGEA